MRHMQETQDLYWKLNSLIQRAYKWIQLSHDNSELHILFLTQKYSFLWIINILILIIIMYVYLPQLWKLNAWR